MSEAIGGTEECFLNKELNVDPCIKEFSLEEELSSDNIALKDKQLQLKECSISDLKMEQGVTDYSEVNLEVNLDISVDSPVVKRCDSVKISEIPELKEISISVIEEMKEEDTFLNLEDNRNTFNNETREVDYSKSTEQNDKNINEVLKTDDINIRNNIYDPNRNNDDNNQVSDTDINLKKGDNGSNNMKSSLLQDCTDTTNFCVVEQINNDGANIPKLEIDQSNNDKSLKHNNTKINLNKCFEMNKDYNVDFLEKEGIVLVNEEECLVNKTSSNTSKEDSISLIEVKNINCDIKTPHSLDNLHDCTSPANDCDVQYINNDSTNIPKLDNSENNIIEKSLKHQNIKNNLNECLEVNKGPYNVVLLENKAVILKNEQECVVKTSDSLDNLHSCIDVINVSDVELINNNPISIPKVNISENSNFDKSLENENKESISNDCLDMKKGIVDSIENQVIIFKHKHLLSSEKINDSDINENILNFSKEVIEATVKIEKAIDSCNLAENEFAKSEVYLADNNMEINLEACDNNVDFCQNQNIDVSTNETDPIKSLSITEESRTKNLNEILIDQKTFISNVNENLFQNEKKSEDEGNMVLMFNEQIDNSVSTDKKNPMIDELTNKQFNNLSNVLSEQIIDNNSKVEIFEPNVINTSNIAQISNNLVVSDKTNTASEKSESLISKHIDINDTNFLESIAQKLNDRDLSLYEKTFIGCDSEKNGETNNCSSNIATIQLSVNKNAKDNNSLFEDNETKIAVTEINLSNVNSNENSLKNVSKNLLINKHHVVNTDRNVIQTEIIHNFSSSKQLDVAGSYSSLTIKTNTKDEELLLDKSSDFKKNDKISLSTNLINANDSSKSSAEFKQFSEIKSDVINITNEEVSKSDRFSNNDDKYQKVNKACNDDSIHYLQKSKTNCKDLNKDLGNKKAYNSTIGTESMDRRVSESADKPELIDKFQSMTWLKSNSDMNIRSTLKHLTDKKDEYKSDTSEGTKNCRNGRKSRLITSQNRIRNEKSNISSLEYKAGSGNVHEHSVWNNNNTAKQLFPKAHSTVIDHTCEEEALSIALAESICTAQQESEIRERSRKDLRPLIEDNIDDDDSWTKIKRNLPDNSDGGLNNTTEIKKSENSTEVFVDKFGRVDGLSEKRLFMGKGARRKEQEFLKSFTENKNQVQSNSVSSSGFQAQPFPRKSSQDSNIFSQENKKGINLTKNEQDKDSVLDNDKKEVHGFNKSQERPIHGRSDKKITFSNQKEACFKQSKNMSDKNSDRLENVKRYQNPNEKYYESNKQSQCDKYRVNSSQSQGNYNRSQNYSDRYQENASKNQEPFYKSYNRSYDKNYTTEKSQDSVVENKEHLKRSQNYSSKSYDGSGQNQDRINRNRDTNKSREYFNNKRYDDNWDENETNSNFNSQRQPDNKNQLLSNQKEFKDKSSHDFTNQKYVVKAEESKKVNLDNKSDSIKQTSSKSSSSMENSDNTLQKSSQNMGNTCILKEIKNDSKEGVEEVQANATYVNICDSSASESKPNVVMSFVGNQNVQRALGLNPNTFNTLQVANHQINKNDVSMSNVTDSSSVNSFINSNMISHMSFSQSVPCANFNTSLTYSNSMPNVNPAVYDVLNYTGNQGIDNQYSTGADFGFNHSPTTDISIEQLRMNEISNNSQVLLKLHNKVDSLSKELASTQALLLAAQMKAFTNLSSHNSLPIQNQSLPNQFPLDFLPPNYSTPPGFSNTNIQQVQSEVLQPNSPVDQRFNFQAFQHGNVYQQSTADLQQYSSNINLANAIPRGRSIPQNIERREMRGTGSQFYHK